MKLYKVDATYSRGNAINIPFVFYIVAEDEHDAANKNLVAISALPDDMTNWCLVSEPQEIASSLFISLHHLLIE